MASELTFDDPLYNSIKLWKSLLEVPQIIEEYTQLCYGWIDDNGLINFYNSNSTQEMMQELRINTPRDIMINEEGDIHSISLSMSYRDHYYHLDDGVVDNMFEVGIAHSRFIYSDYSRPYIIVLVAIPMNIDNIDRNLTYPLHYSLYLPETGLFKPPTIDNPPHSGPLPLTHEGRTMLGQPFIFNPIDPDVVIEVVQQIYRNENKAHQNLGWLNQERGRGQIVDLIYRSIQNPMDSRPLSHTLSRAFFLLEPQYNIESRYIMPRNPEMCERIKHRTLETARLIGYNPIISRQEYVAYQSQSGDEEAYQQRLSDFRRRLERITHVAPAVVPLQAAAPPQTAAQTAARAAAERAAAERADAARAAAERAAAERADAARAAAAAARVAPRARAAPRAPVAAPVAAHAAAPERESEKADKTDPIDLVRRMRCGVCLDRLNNVTLRCGHMMCHICYDRLVQRNMTCPGCRGPLNGKIDLYYKKYLKYKSKYINTLKLINRSN